MTRAEITRRLLDAGWSPIPAHEAVTQGEVPDDVRNPEATSIIDELEAVAAQR